MTQGLPTPQSHMDKSSRTISDLRPEKSILLGSGDQQTHIETEATVFIKLEELINESTAQKVDLSSTITSSRIQDQLEKSSRNTVSRYASEKPGSDIFGNT